MKRKPLLIVLIIALASIVFTGCSTANTNKTQHKAKAAHAQAKQKKQEMKGLMNFIGMTQKDYRTERKSGKSIADIAKEKNKTEQQVIDFLVNQRETAFKKNKPNASADTLKKKEQQWTKSITAQVEKKPKVKKGA